MNGFRLKAVVVVTPKEFSFSFTKTTQKIYVCNELFFFVWLATSLFEMEFTVACSLGFLDGTTISIARCDFGVCASLCVESGARMCVHVYETAVDRSLHNAKPNLIPIQKCICENACVLHELCANSSDLRLSRMYT